jgi:hypothetical protein
LAQFLSAHDNSQGGSMGEYCSAVDTAATQSPTQAVADPYKTGFPGRPTIKHLIKQEFDRRIEASAICTELANEAKELRNWAETHYPEAKTPTEKTIKNNIRGRFRDYWGAKDIKSTRKDKAQN